MRRGLAALACVLAACGRSTAPSEPVPTPPVPTAGSDAVAIAVATGDAAAAIDAAAPAAIPAATRQLVTAIVPDWTSTTAELRLWSRDGATWQPVGPAWRGVVGKTGTAWGIGLHGTGAPAGRDGPVKREGDGKTPAGVFALRGSYGYAPAPPTGTRLPYTALEPSWKCVDDPASRHYNQIVDQRTTTVDWRSAEDMRRTDVAYAWVVEVAHNPARTGGDGSCIFLHVWGGPGSTTIGCTAMDATRLAALIGELEPAAAPTFVLLPRAEYDALADGWALPRP